MYTQYYSPADAFVYLSKDGSNLLQLDKIAGIGINESLDSTPIYGLGDSEFGFISQGNVIANGFIDINVIHVDYLKKSIDYILGISNDKNEDKKKITFASFKRMTASELSKLAYAENSNISGKINSIGRDIDISILLNNSNPLRPDIIPSRINLTNIVITGSSLNIISEQDGQIINRYFFIGKRK